MARCTPCVEKKLRRMVTQLTKENKEAEARAARYRQVLEQIAEEEETLGWIYAARMAKQALKEKNK